MVNGVSLTPSVSIEPSPRCEKPVVPATTTLSANKSPLAVMSPLAGMGLNVGLPAVPKLVKSIVVDVDALFILILA